MSLRMLLEYSYLLEALLCVCCAIALFTHKLVGKYKVLTALISARFIVGILAYVLLFHRRAVGITHTQATVSYLVGLWTDEIVEGCLTFLLIYATFWEAMRPLEGLHNIGKIIFRWVCGVSLAFSIAIAAGPQTPESSYYIIAMERFGNGISLLTLCLLLFVCLAIRPLGLTYRSRTFGISLGLGTMTSMQLILSAWIAAAGSGSFYSPYFLMENLGYCLGLAIWLTYFLLPEPERMMILLPTTSPFFFWNRVSEVLGDDPGMVAVGGIHPEMLAAAELKVMTGPPKSAHAASLGGESMLNLAEKSLPPLPTIATSR